MRGPTLLDPVCVRGPRLAHRGDRAAWKAGPYRQRSRDRAQLERGAGLDQESRRVLARHRPRQADAERDLRSLQFEDVGRAPERDAVSRARPCRGVVTDWLADYNVY